MKTLFRPGRYWPKMTFAEGSAWSNNETGIPWVLDPANPVPRVCVSDRIFRAQGSSGSRRACAMEGMSYWVPPV